MGKVIAMTKCPFHGDTDPSLAIYDDGYYCFGCHAKGKLQPWMVDIAHQKPFKQSSITTIKQLRNIEQYDYRYETSAKQFFKDRDIRLDIAKECELKYYQDKLMSPIYNYHGDISGRQIRYIYRKPKYRLLPILQHKQKLYPKYCRMLPDIPITTACWVVESVYDGAKLYQGTSLPSIAILGTKMPESLLMNMARTSKIYDTKWLLYLDPDAHVISRLLSEKMIQYGLDGKTIMSNKKPYEQLDEDLEELANDML